MANMSHITNYDQDTFWTAPARNFRTSARLHLQHFLFQNTLGYLLEPAVEQAVTSSPSQILKVADLACGNGVWLTELHDHLAKKNVPAQFDGFDINPINLPHAAYLPESVTLRELDVLAKPLPAELIGAYDVVHLRAFVSVVSDNDPSSIISVAMQLLKPGGFLQWEETRGDQFTADSPAADAPKSALEGIVQLMRGSMAARGVTNEWVETLDDYMRGVGFRDARLLTREKRKQDYKGWTEDYLTVWEELAVFFPPKAQAPTAPMSREAWIDLFARGVKETEQGAVVHQKKVFTAIGQKPN